MRMGLFQSTTVYQVLYRIGIARGTLSSVEQGYVLYVDNLALTLRITSRDPTYTSHNVLLDYFAVQGFHTTILYLRDVFFAVHIITLLFNAPLLNTTLVRISCTSLVTVVCSIMFSDKIHTFNCCKKMDRNIYVRKTDPQFWTLLNNCVIFSFL